MSPTSIRFSDSCVKKLFLTEKPDVKRTSAWIFLSCFGFEELPRYNFLTAFSARSIHPHPNKSHLIDGFKILLATLIDEQRQSYMRLSFPSAEATR
ncbi:unnamed protein product [Brassica oleracea]|uniref:(rape) hypothetical protein n=1 Tax=Brassica napus TaxID=3708 RepID=A0A816ISH7_BRANA|nr:unnamed protein product [Brassica napus]